MRHNGPQRYGIDSDLDVAGSWVRVEFQAFPMCASDDRKEKASTP